MQGRPEYLRRHVFVHLVQPSPGAEVEAETGTDAAGATAALDQIVLRRPDCRVVGHIVVGGEELK